MGRSPRCSKDGLNRGAWTAAEDKLLTDYIKIHGEGKWSNVAKKTGLKRCGKSCRLRWMNYLRPDIKRGNISQDEEELIIRLHKLLGNRWSLIAGRLPGRTDNEIKNYWNTNLAKKASELSVQLRHKIKPKLKPLDDQPAAAASNIAKAAKILPDNNVLATPEEYKHQHQNQQQQQQQCQDHNNYNVQLPAANMDGNWPSNYMNCETESSDASPSSANGKVHLLDFMNIDFNIEDFCKMLDSDLTKFNYEVNVNVNDSDHLVEEDGVIIVPESEPLLSFPVNMEELEKSRGSEVAETNKAPEFLSLASSFLESADQEWPGDELNLIHAD